MPRSAVATGCVDFVLSPENIANELARIAKHPYVAGLVEPLTAMENNRASATAREDDETPLPAGGHGTPLTEARAEAAHGKPRHSGFKKILVSQSCRRRFLALQIQHHSASHRTQRVGRALCRKCQQLDNAKNGIFGPSKSPGQFLSFRSSVEEMLRRLAAIGSAICIHLVKMRARVLTSSALLSSRSVCKSQTFTAQHAQSDNDLL